MAPSASVSAWAQRCAGGIGTCQASNRSLGQASGALASDRKRAVTSGYSVSRAGSSGRTTGDGDGDGVGGAGVAVGRGGGVAVVAGDGVGIAVEMPLPPPKQAVGRRTVAGSSRRTSRRKGPPGANDGRRSPQL